MASASTDPNPGPDWPAMVWFNPAAGVSGRTAAGDRMGVMGKDIAAISLRPYFIKSMERWIMSLIAVIAATFPS
jgi:hypothetical protein